jgi:hypothetical protein
METRAAAAAKRKRKQVPTPPKPHSIPSRKRKAPEEEKEEEPKPKSTRCWRRNALKSAMMRAWLEGKACVDCGCTAHELLTNDHRNPEEKLCRKNGKRFLRLKDVPICHMRSELLKTDPVCPVCHMVREHVRNHQPLSTMTAARAKRVRLVRNEKLKRGKCCRCGLSVRDKRLRGALRCFDFHHPDPKRKLRAIAKMVSDSWSIEDIIREMKKCLMMCSNCHKSITDCGYRPLNSFPPEIVGRARLLLFGTEEERAQAYNPRTGCPSSVSVQQVDPATGKVVRVHASVSEAVRQTPKTSQSTLRKSLNKSRKIYAGFLWRSVRDAG